MYYKVVIRMDGELFSCGIPYGRTFLGRKYVPNAWTMAHKIAIKNGLGLMVFDSLKHAKNFIRFTVKLEVWECEIIPFPSNIEAKSFGFATLYSNIDTGIAKLYERYGNGNYKWNVLQWPKGTIFASAVKLVKKVDIIKS